MFEQIKLTIANTTVHSTPMMDLLVQIATAHKLTASSYTLQAIGERGLVLPHHPNTPIGALDALQVILIIHLARRNERKDISVTYEFIICRLFVS